MANDYPAQIPSISFRRPHLFNLFNKEYYGGTPALLDRFNDADVPLGCQEIEEATSLVQ